MVVRVRVRKEDGLLKSRDSLDYK